MSESQDLQPGGLVPAAEAAPSSNVNETILAADAAASEAVVTKAATVTEDAAPSLFDATEEAMGDRPEWLPEKFKTGEDLSKSYQALEKKLGAHSGAPENYEMTVEAGLEDYALDSENSLAKGFLDVMKENGVNQQTANALMNLHASQTKADEEVMAMAEEQTFQDDCKALGPDKVQEIKESIKKVRGMVSDESFELLQSIGNKNLVVGKMVDELMKAYDSKDFVKMPETAAKVYNKADLHEEIKARLVDPRSARDRAFSKKTTEMYEALLS